MKILDNNIVRDMTPEEEAQAMPLTPIPPEIATIEDYENALAEVGVK